MNDTKNEKTEETNQALTIEELNIEELEQRLELAAANAICACDKYA